MALLVFVFLLMVCPLLCLALLWRHDWLHLQPCSSRGEAKGTTLHRLLKPRSPDDCPTCRLASPASSGVEPAPAPVRPWREVLPPDPRDPDVVRVKPLARAAQLMLRVLGQPGTIHQAIGIAS